MHFTWCARVGSFQSFGGSPAQGQCGLRRQQDAHKSAQSFVTQRLGCCHEEQKGLCFPRGRALACRSDHSRAGNGGQRQWESREGDTGVTGSPDCTTREREGGLHMEKQHLQKLSLRCRKNRKKNHTGVKDKRQTNHRNALLKN